MNEPLIVIPYKINPQELILPSDPSFCFYRESITPPNWLVEGKNLVIDLETGLFRAVDEQALYDYALGGEYEERMRITGGWDEENDCQI
jgi:hypothetical protein